MSPSRAPDLEAWRRKVRCLRCRCVSTNPERPRPRYFTPCPRCGHPCAEYFHAIEDRP